MTTCVSDNTDLYQFIDLMKFHGARLSCPWGYWFYDPDKFKLKFKDLLNDNIVDSFTQSFNELYQFRFVRDNLNLFTYDDLIIPYTSVRYVK